MASLDIILLGIIFITTFLGLVLGFVYSFGVLFGNIVAVVAAGYLMEPVAQWTNFLFFGNTNLARIVVFILIFVLVSNIFGLIFWVVNKVFKLVSILPFIKTINRIVGALLGFLTGSLTVGISLFIIVRYPVDPVIIQMLLDSNIAKGLLVLAKILSPLLPESIRAINEIMYAY